MEENERIFDIRIEIDPPFTSDTMPFFVQKLILETKEKEKIMKKEIETHPHILANEKIKSLDRSVPKTTKTAKIQKYLKLTIFC